MPGQRLTHLLRFDVEDPDAQRNREVVALDLVAPLRRAGHAEQWIAAFGVKRPAATIEIRAVLEMLESSLFSRDSGGATHVLVVKPC